MFKDEPDDLTHLAPTPGDDLVHLESNPYDMLDEFILSDNYCSLLGDDFVSASPGDSLGGEPLLMSSPDTQVLVITALYCVIYCPISFLFTLN